MSREAVADVVGRYSVALDSHSWDLFDDIFLPDVEADYPGPLHWHDLASFKRDFRQMHETTMAGHVHFLGVPQVVIDGERAFALTYGRFVVFTAEPGNAGMEPSEGGVWYDDKLVRAPAGWRIRKRVARQFWVKRPSGDNTGFRTVESFPEWVKTGRVGYVNALREQLRAASATAS